jgi:transposase-like protein
MVEQVPNMISIKGCHFPRHVILHAVHVHLRYSVSLRDMEEILVDRGVAADHVTLSRWLMQFSPLVTIEAKKTVRAKRCFLAYGRDLPQSSGPTDVFLSRG